MYSRKEIDEYRVVVLGSGGVGKSTLTIRLLTDNFLDEYDPTIEDSYRKQILLDNEPILLDILDTAGQEEFKSMRDQWIRDGDGFLLVYAINSAHSFYEINKLREHIFMAKDSEEVPIVIAGNKCDLVNDREVSTEEGKALADNWGVPFFETSAKAKKNNQVAFYKVVREIRRLENQEDDDDDTNGKKKKKKGGKRLPCNIL